MRLSKLAYFADLYISPVAIAVLMLLALSGGAVRAAPIYGLGLFSGVLAWTLIEYIVHRYLYHHFPVLSDLHDAHHAEPDSYIGAPAIIGVVMIGVLGLATWPLLGMTLSFGFTSGLFAGYIGYMLVHHGSHHWNPEPGTWLYALKRHHALHHHRSEGCNFGIVSSFWDRVFGTAYAHRERPRAG